MAAVPFSKRGRYGKRAFDEEGLPFCEAQLAMSLPTADRDGASRLSSQRVGNRAPEVAGQAVDQQLQHPDLCGAELERHPVGEKEAGRSFKVEL